MLTRTAVMSKTIRQLRFSDRPLVSYRAIDHCSIIPGPGSTASQAVGTR